MAKAFGAEVTGVCSTPKVDLVRSLGADHVIDYTQEDFADERQRYDVILDIGGNASLSRLRQRPHPEGDARDRRAARRADGWLAGSDRQIRALVLSRFVGQKLAHVRLQGDRRRTWSSSPSLIESGKVTPVVDRTYPLSEVPEAIRYMERGKARGKVVITTGT